MTEQSSSPMMQEVTGRPIIADVTARRAGDRVAFDLEWRREGEPAGKNGPIEVGKGDPATPIHFHLRDETGLRLSFVKDPAQAMWVSTVGCPPSEAGDGGQIRFLSSANKLLRVSDANEGSECTLYYMLRFDGDTEGAMRPPYEFDPIIRNGGGGGGGFI